MLFNFDELALNTEGLSQICHETAQKCPSGKIVFESMKWSTITFNPLTLVKKKKLFAMEIIFLCCFSTPEFLFNQISLRKR